MAVQRGSRRQDPAKVPLDANVHDSARERVRWALSSFERVYLSAPSGKDSGVMMHIACEVARELGRKVGVLYVDLEGQYSSTIDFVHRMFDIYADVIDPYWVALPLHLRNAVSGSAPYWVCWDPNAESMWIRPRPARAISDEAYFPWFERAMEFEEFIERFGWWYGGGKSCACLVGIRADESLNRWRAIVRPRASRFQGKAWTTWKGDGLVNVYPIYDWRTEDIWTFFGRTGLPYPRLYDAMYKAGLSIHQMRICQPYGDDQRRGLAMWHVIEPDTWARVVARVAGANHGALYAGKRGNILGNGKIELPATHSTWESYARFLLDTMPAGEAEHYRNKIAVFLHWYQCKGIDPIPDEADPKEEAARRAPSWRRICKVLLRHDRMCRGLGFSQQSSTVSNYLRYRKMMRARRERWDIGI